MRAAALLIALISLASCSSSDPKSLTDAGAKAMNSGDVRTALKEYEAALSHMDATHPEYVRASVGRCQALARLQPDKAKTEFLALAKAQPAKVQEQDFHIVVSEFVTNRKYIDAIDVMEAGIKMYADSPKMKAIKELVISESKKSQDPEVLKHLTGHGYF